MSDEIPKLDDLIAEDFWRLMKEGAERRKADGEDRRRLRGKYAPPTGVCRVCSGKVVADIKFHHDGRIGGPPSNGYVGGWHCEGCFLMYRQCPSELETSAAEVKNG